MQRLITAVKAERTAAGLVSSDKSFKSANCARL
jgi:hypothetical protein